MKFYLLFIALVFWGTTSASAQSKEDVAQKKGIIYFSFNGSLFKEFSMNTVLEEGNLPKLSKFSLGTSVGTVFFFNRHAVNLKAGVFRGNDLKKNDFKSSYTGGTVSASYSYNLFDIKKSRFLIGVGYNQLKFNGNIYSKAVSTDLTQLNSESLAGSLNLNNTSHLIDFHLWLLGENTKKWTSAFSIKVSYSLDISKPDWKSENSVSQTFSEDFSQINLALLFPIKSW